MIDQFEPWYFGVAFPFIFKYCTGMPDMPAWTKAPRYRREKNAPRIEADAWVRVMSRRVEAQVNRDWTFGFVSWNYIFRSSINLFRTFFAYQHKGDSEQYSGLDGNSPQCASAGGDDAIPRDAVLASSSSRPQEESFTRRSRRTCC